MAWDDAVVTNIGTGLLGQVPDGEGLRLDGAVGGAGTVGPVALMAQAGVADQRQAFPIASAADTPNGKKIGVLVTNAGLASGYTMRQLGIMASAGGEPGLYAILQDNAGIYIPSENEVPDFSLTFYAVLAYSNKASFSVVVDPSALATHGALAEALEAHGEGLGVRFAAIESAQAAHGARLGAIETAQGAHKAQLEAIEAAQGAHAGNTSNPHKVKAAQVDAVPTSRTVDGKALTEDIFTDAAIMTVEVSLILARDQRGLLIAVNSTSAKTITVPANNAIAGNFPTGTEIEVLRQGTGSVTIAAASGVTIWCAKTERTIANRYGSVALKKMDTNTWLLQGDVGATK